MKKSILIASLLFVLLGETVWAQNPSVSISPITACPGADVAVSVDAANLFDVGAITLFIAYDISAVEYVAVNNVHPQLGGLLYNHLLVPQPMVAMSWASVAGVNIAAGKLFDIQYHYKNGQGAFTFLPNCEISTTELVVLEVDYSGGTIQPSLVVINQPADQSVYEGQPTGFIVGSNAAVAYQWQRSTNQGATFIDIGETANYSGADTQELEIATTNLSMNGNLFRCRLTAPGCAIYSREALLEVQALTVQTFQFRAGWNTFSVAVQPASLSVGDLFSNLGNQLIFLTDGDEIYYPAGGINSLVQIDPSAGYFLKSSGDATLDVTGVPTNPPTIPIAAGWNLLPVLTQCDVEIGTLPANVLSKIETIVEIAGGSVYWPAKNIFMLNTLQATKMYRLKANEDFEWSFPACNP